MPTLPLKPRSPAGRAQAQPTPPLLPRSHSYNALSRPPATEGPFDGLLHTRRLRNTLLVLIAMVLAINGVWAAQAVAAWSHRLGRLGPSQPQLLLQRLNSTTLSLEVSRVGADEGEQRSTYVVNAQLLDGSVGGQGDAISSSSGSTSGDAVGQAGGHQPARAGDFNQSALAAVSPKSQQKQGSSSNSLLERLRAAGSALGLVVPSDDKASRARGSADTSNTTAPPPPHRAVLKMPEVLERSTDSCAQALQLPRVALLFLTRGELYHHDTWRLWFEAARDMVPAEQLRTAACAAVGAPSVEAAPPAETQQNASSPGQQPGQQVQGHEGAAVACGWDVEAGQRLASGGRSALDQQHLFSVYIHAPPDVTDALLPELFRGRLVSGRILPEWGSHQLVEATRSLLWEAFRDPLNQRFVLLSESDIPLYDPLTLYQQLLAEERSCVNLCRRAAPTDTRRWTWRMSGPTLKSWHWRKSSQWFGMLRSHVQVVLQDVEVFRKFEEHCWNGWDGDYKRWRDCFSDEHYIPTLLATKGLDAESFCHIDGVAATDWSAGGPHPKNYKSWEVQPGLIRRAQGVDRGCNASAAIADAQRRYVTKQAAFGVGGERLCSSALAAIPAFEHALPGTCSLTARKFPKPTVHAVHRLFVDCRNKLQLLGTACSRGKVLAA